MSVIELDRLRSIVGLVFLFYNCLVLLLGFFCEWYCNINFVVIVWWVIKFLYMWFYCGYVNGFVFDNIDVLMIWYFFILNLYVYRGWCIVVCLSGVVECGL